MLTAKAIKTICHEEGFLKCGISKAEILNSESEYLKNWIEEGKNADMHWINKGYEKRKDISLVMPEVKSVISLAFLYDTPFEHNQSLPKISRYAWGKDYHKILKKKLKTICDKIESLDSNIKTKFYVDDGPVMEKVWAEKSGIGWIGKHTNILNSEYGSFFFLCEILINIELEYDKPIDNLCETCRICVDACPTGALEEYKLDANLCISYHTIENKNELPAHLNFENWIFGCDICQDVCPFNKRKFFTEEKSFYPNPIIFNKSKEELSEITEEKFNEIFSGTPVKRTKYSGFKRNLNVIN